MNIQGKVVVLRAPEPADLDILHKWANDPELWQHLVGWHFPYNSISTKNWIETQGDGNLRGHVFAIDTPDLGVIGTANLVDIDWINRVGFHGMMLGDKDIRGRGYGIDTVMAIMRYAFDVLGLERLDGSMIETNAGSIKFYCEKLGWQVEGRQRRRLYRNGQFIDKVIVGVTRDDYAQLLKRTNYWD